MDDLNHHMGAGNHPVPPGELSVLVTTEPSPQPTVHISEGPGEADASLPFWREAAVPSHCLTHDPLHFNVLFPSLQLLTDFSVLRCVSTNQQQKVKNLQVIDTVKPSTELISIIHI